MRSGRDDSTAWRSAYAASERLTSRRECWRWHGSTGCWDNVEYLLGDGESFRGIEDASADACVSHVVFQHIPDPEITLAYVREIGRVLRPGGWAAFQVSNDHRIHRRRTGLEGLGIWGRALIGRGPRKPGRPGLAWLSDRALRPRPSCRGGRHEGRADHRRGDADVLRAHPPVAWWSLIDARTPAAAVVSPSRMRWRFNPRGRGSRSGW